jgi:hypothetical protein
MPVHVFRLNDDQPVRFAAAELQRYLKKMSGQALPVRRASSYAPGTKGLWLGTADAFGSRAPGGGGWGPARLRPPADPCADGVFVSADRGHAVITGPNGRSVLFAAYRYLEELGCRWLRPGRLGEHVPCLKDPWLAPVRVRETPSTRYRVMVIEGSCSEQHVTNMVDYAAKRGFNGYFLQLLHSYFVFERWYGKEQCRNGRRRPAKRARRLSDEEAREHYDSVKAEMRKRGLIIQSMGHGWTHWPLGIRGHTFAAVRAHIPPAVRRHLALIRGKRDLFGGVPINTNLCTSNPRVRTLVATAVADYAQEHPDEQMVHVWLADGANNTCECAECRKQLPSDYYVMMLNEVDELLERRGLPTRIIFLAYRDLLWAPRKERIQNPERFLLMFAPISRSYSTAYVDQRGGRERVAPFRRNRLTFPSTPRGNLEMLAAWRKVFPGECVLFDYHLWRDYVRDPGQMVQLPVLYRDVRNLAQLGLDGFLAVTTQRNAFPTGVSLDVLGRTLWDKRRSLRPVLDAYFHDLFGPEGAEVKRYLTRLSEAFDPVFLRGEKKGEQARRTAVANFRTVGRLVESFLSTLDKGEGAGDAVRCAAWQVLRDHARYVALLARVLAAAFTDDGEAAARLFAQLCRRLDRSLPRLHAVLDTSMVQGETWRMLRQANVAVPRPGTA